jgi:hypothetical protein
MNLPFWPAPPFRPDLWRNYFSLSSARSYRLRLARRLTFSLFAQRESKQRENAPGIRPCASRRVRSLHRRSRSPLRRALHGPAQLSRHPCRSTPSTPTPLTLLTGSFSPCNSKVIRKRFGSRPIPVRRPSAGAVQRGIWHGCQMRSAGPWMALRDDPLNSAVARAVERSETRMPGGVSLPTFFAQAKKVGRPAGRNLSYLMQSIFTSGTKRSTRRMLCP